MALVPVPISNGFYVSESLPISAQRCVNLYPNIPQSDTVTDDNLFDTPGIVEIARVSDTKVTRGAHVMAGIPYFVIGQNLHRLNLIVVEGVDTFTTTDLGTIEGIARVTMADNGIELCIVAEPDGITLGKSYIFVEPATLTEITDVNFDGPANSVRYIDKFFNFVKDDGKKIFNSPLASGLGPYDPLDFTDAVADPDKIVAQEIYRSNMYLIGTETTQVFEDIGRSPAPFRAIQGAVIDIGIFAPKTVALFAGLFVFVGGGVNEAPSVWSVSGKSKTKISTTAIDNELGNLTDSQLENLFTLVYSEQGAFFFGIVFPDTSFWYDARNQRWHERQSTVDENLTRYRVAAIVTAYGRLIVGDAIDGRIGVLDKDIFTEYGEVVQRFAITKPFDNFGKPLFVAFLELVIESGVGLTGDVDGADPKVTLFLSSDGGRTFGAGLSRSMGRTGEFTKRPRWPRLGRFDRSVVLKFEVTSPTKTVLIKAEADVA